MKHNLQEKLTEELTNATREALKLLFKNGECFYYCSLVTTGEGHSPVLTAWSLEALDRIASEDSDFELAKEELKWSYADSPYFAFDEDRFLTFRSDFDDACVQHKLSSESRFDFVIDLMENAMSRLDEEGLFGEGEKRLGVVVNAEVMPPDYTNTIRAKRLNPLPALTTWLEEAAEP